MGELGMAAGVMALGQIPWLREAVLWLAGIAAGLLLLAWAWPVIQWILKLGVALALLYALLLGLALMVGRLPAG